MSANHLTKKISLEPSAWPSRSGNIPSLDGLRAVSISIVLIGHFVLPSSLVGVSALGLVVFFFISGFLITRLLLAEHESTGSISLPNFYFRRVIRLYPVLLVYLAVVIPVMVLRGQPVDGLQVASVFLYFVNYLHAHYDLTGQAFTMPVSVLWSLSVEEHFYLFAPVLLAFVRADARRVLKIALAVVLGSLALRFLYAAIWPGLVDTLVIYRHSETRFDAIAFGVILACLCDLPQGRKLIGILISPVAMVAGAALLAGSFLYRDNYYENTVRFTLQSLALFPLVSGVVFGQSFRFANQVLNSQPFVWVGKLSYSLYVWHGGVVFLFGWMWLNQSRPVVILGEVVFTFLLAILSYYLIERPTLRLRSRFSPGHKRPATPASGFAS